MTEQEFRGLNPQKLYRIQFHNGEEMVGLITWQKSEDGAELVVPFSKRIEMHSHESDRAEWLRENAIHIYPPAVAQVKEHLSGKEDTHIPRVFENMNFKVKKLLIFGAGASYDFSFADNFRKNGLTGNRDPMPLTKDLFSDQYSVHSHLFPGVEYLRPSLLHMSDNLEEYFNSLWLKTRKTYDDQLLRSLLNVQFYLQALFIRLSLELQDEVKNNFASLLRSAHEYVMNHSPTQRAMGEKIGIISFNYDLLLERLLSKYYGYKFEHIDNYIDYTKHDFLYFKPHGSANWIRPCNTGIGRDLNSDELIGYSSYIYQNASLFNMLASASKEVHIVNTHIEGGKPKLSRRPENRKPFVPQLLIPYSEKDEFVMPEKHTALLETILNDVEEILIVGWKGTESKMLEMFSQRISKREVKVVILGSPNHEETSQVGRSINLRNLEIEKFNHHNIFKKALPNARYYTLKGFSNYERERVRNPELDFFQDDFTKGLEEFFIGTK